MSDAQRQMLQVVPVNQPADWTPTEFLAGHLLPWGVPSLLGLRGHPTSDAGAPEIIVGYEWPFPLIEVGNRLTREALERWHLHQYLTHETLRHGQPPYMGIRRGEEPPDFRATWAGAEVGLDCARLTTERGLLAQAQFDRLRRAVLEIARERLAHLSGHHVYVWFPTADGPDLPTRGETAMREVAEALATHSVDTTWLEHPVPEGSGPPVLNEFSFDDRSVARFYAFPMGIAVPTTRFFTETGFELGLALSTRISIADAWIECKRIIAEHDRAPIDHLLLTVGGPTEMGVTFPSEQFVFGDVLPLVDQDPIECGHLTRVVVHNAVNGEVIQLVPEPGRWAPAYPGGSVPAFLSREPRPFPIAEVERPDD